MNDDISALAILGEESVSGLVAKIADRSNPQTRAQATEIVKRAREQGVLAVIFREASDGQSLEVLCDANDHDETTVDALMKVPPRALIKRLIVMPVTAIQWQLAPLKVAVAALLMMNIELLRYDEATSDFPLDDDDVDVLAAVHAQTHSKDDDVPDAPISEGAQEDENGVLSYLVELKRAFSSLFERHDGAPPNRYDGDVALSLGFNGGETIALLLAEGNEDDLLSVISRDHIESWVADLIGEDEVALPPVEPQPEMVDAAAVEEIFSV